MIYVDMCGRLGNQMFQYAMARRIQVETGDEIAISSYTVAKDNWGENDLRFFQIVPFVDLGNKHNVLLKDTSLWQKVVGYSYFFYYKKMCKDYEDVRRYQIKKQPLLNKAGICWMNKGFYQYDYNYFKKGAIVKGNFENPKFFDDIRNLLKKEFTPIEPPRVENEELYKIINENNSVCISIRKGDHVKVAETRKYFHVYEDSYFLTAMDIMAQKVENPIFIIFSDDIEWVRNNIEFKYPVYFETGNDPVWEKLRLMYSCKHFVLSNSTFSWWAQYLSDNVEKVVISPKKWINDRYDSELNDEKWILI
ncbi:alpha-1,2-fucosyltransferase [Roseburia sp. 499]|uniref:alpha-1,2-fucosyltransferase n=1 Tax=Roseburia sp. 499 TaxID=1261634 RepID=UPI000953496B|nr:alpha-1,2-fucosyltransferase [Roseburia sp. 499]WVK69293.1 alpha-1,2-fucosyltransferase [Roseburia sp. 499]